MCLVEVGTLLLKDCDEPAHRHMSTYAILGHTWSTDGVLLADMQPQNLDATRQKAGYSRVYHASEQAAPDGCTYLCADTCCMVKTSSAELQ